MRANVTDAEVATKAVNSLGGRYSVQLNIDVDRGGDQIERWALAATLFSVRISANIAERTFVVLDEAGVRSIADAGRRDLGRLIELLDAGGYARYDLRTAERLHAIARKLETEYGGRVSAVLDLPPDRLGAALIGHHRCCLDHRREKAYSACPRLEGLVKTSLSRRVVRCRLSGNRT